MTVTSTVQLITVPYWNVNVALSDHTEECPEFLSNLGAKDIKTLSTPNALYRSQTWPEVRNQVSSNNLERFQRWPSELRRYRAFTHQLIKEHGSIANFILSQRLGWQEPVKPRGLPFQYDDDVKILYNDWPYGIDHRIVHLVVWIKFRFEENPKTGDLSDKARRETDEFVTRIFRSRVPSEKIIWFRNWAAIKSVHAVEHFHVMLFDPDPDFICEVTGGDVPQCEIADV